jgi:HK97 family phage prohead protease
MSLVHVRSWSAALEVRGDDGRTIVGIAVPYGQSATIGYRTTETFVRGAFTGADPSGIPLAATHPKDGAELPIGVTTELREEADGLHGAWRVSRTQLGDEVLELVRDGALSGLSIGFIELPGGNQWTADRSHVTRTRAALDHVAVVRVPAYPGARIAALRAAHTPQAPLLRLALRRP